MKLFAILLILEHKIQQ
ncbi:hypothetical protein JI435_423110 [Parastagonospora nodorum SN15]|uniref:Uncharacterized protein n=1 Tax=Phaeosphaeria nodorum (strain SN15 / ATCC MYA-4574 / FGSC 10173) TaxID=321614 RepID=A0A7U2IAK0_PHANO|nr:hypothetical protein JI435_423110 [Parastagonospora nodorum SN15]